MGFGSGKSPWIQRSSYWILMKNRQKALEFPFLTFQQIEYYIIKSIGNPAVCLADQEDSH